MPVRRIALFLCGLAVTLVVAPTAYAESSDDYLDVVVNGLEDARVYVAPGTPGTDADTAVQLEARLTEEDAITLVMLPPDAAETITAPRDFVQQVAVKLGNDDVLGVAIGEDVYAYSAILPTGVASDLMNRADSTSVNSVDTLITFTSNVHRWESEHPEAAPAAADGGTSWVLITLLIAVLSSIAAAWAYAAYRKMYGARAASDKVKFDKTPDKVRSHLDKIWKLREQVLDPDLQRTLRQCSVDLERYFAHNSSDVAGDAMFFGNHLESVVEVLRKYLDIQANARYYDDAPKELQNGKAAIEGFAHYVLQSCKNGSQIALMDYKVNTKILDAQRFVA